uniref:Uncharacterized protein n=1 Tax=Amphimedon queenslandica TaxID=400682 RepID=A0A1X7V1R7_AMPQE
LPITMIYTFIPGSIKSGW